MKNRIRQPIVTIAGHVDHGKTSILDCFRGSSIQSGEAGGITQKISFTNYPYSQILKACPFIEKQAIKLDIPGFLFIDTPGHAAFTHLRKRGGSLADLAIVVVSAKEGIQPQTVEVLQILKANKTPFMIAFNKIDTISGWRKKDSVKESVEGQALNVYQEFQEALLTFQGALSQQGFESDLFYDVTDFTKKIALVPCSARSGEGIAELLLVLCGLSQRFLKERLKLGDDAKGVILEVKKEKSSEKVEAILYDGTLKEGDEVAVASFNDLIVTKVRSIEEMLPLSMKYSALKEVTAATGIRLHLKDKEGILAGMPFQKVDDNIEEIRKGFKKDISGVLETDKEGIVIKADSLGSLEALITLLRQEKIQILKAGIGPIGKNDIVNAKANIETNPLNGIVLGFNTTVEDELETGGVKLIMHDVVYKLIEDLQIWRKQKQEEVEREKMLGLATICKLEILPQYIFRNSNPAIFGVRVIAGKLKKGIPLIDQNGEEVGHVKSIQYEKATVNEATAGQELALALPGVAFDRRLKDIQYLYASMGETQFRQFKKNKELLSADEMKVLQQIADMKRKMDEDWGI